MKKIFSLLVLIGFFSFNAYSQFIHKIKADSVLITNDSCNAELNLENSTKDTIGFLYNKGKGRTEFRRGLIRLSDSLYVIGKDTLDIAKGASGNFIRNQNTAAQSANAWISGKFAIGTTAFTTAKLELLTANNTEAFKSAISDGSIISHKGAQGNFSLTPTGTNTVGSIYADGNLSTLGVRSLAGSLIGRMYQSNGSFFIEAPNSGLSITSLNMAQTFGSINLLRLGSGGFQPTSGNATFNALNIQPILNQTGTANGTVYGITYNPTLTSVLGTHYAWHNTTGNAYWGNPGNGRKFMRYFEDYSTNGEVLLVGTSGTGNLSPQFVGVRVNPTHINSGSITAFKADLPPLSFSNGTNVGLLLTGSTQATAVYRGTDVTFSSTNSNSAAVSYGEKYTLSADGTIVYGSQVILTRTGTGASTANLYGYYADVTIPAPTLGTGTPYAFYAATGKNYFADKVLIGSTTDAGNYKLQATGNSFLNGSLTVSNNTSYSGASIFGKVAVTTSGNQTTSVGSVFTNDGLGLSNTYIGSSAGRFLNASSDYNTVLGAGAIGHGVSREVDRTIAIGHLALDVVTSSSNTAIGHQSSAVLTSGTGITIGALSGNDIATGTDNIIVGKNAFTASETDWPNWGNVQHSNVIAIGHFINAGSSLGFTNSTSYATINPSTITNSIIIGNNIGTNKSNAIILGKSNQSTYIASLDTDLTPPSTTGTTKMVVADNEGKLSVAGIPGSVNYSVQSLSDGATINWDAATGISGEVTLGGNRTLSISNLASVAGHTLTLVLKQDGTGSRTLTLPSSCKVINGGGGALSLSTAANAVDVVSFYVHSASIVYVSYGKNFN